MNRRELFKIFGGAAAGIPAVQSIEQLALKPKDTLVLTYEQHLTPADLAGIKDLMERHFPGQHVLILDAGTDIKVVRTA